jgi:SAM-dependent methyltransferase
VDAATKSYTSTKLGILPRAREFAALLAQYRQDAAGLVERSIAQASAVLDEIAQLQGRPIRDLDILEIGSGQKSIQLAVMSMQNRAVGIDRESSRDDLGFGRLIQTVKTDGVMRASKTVARKVLGIDRAMRKEFCRHYGLEKWPSLNIIQMDAENMSFPDESSDIVFSRAVFEHIAEPAAVLRGVTRVLRPGGVFYCLLHLYTSYSGCHDARILAGHGRDIPLWAHLREEHRHRIIENTYLNRLRLSEWQRVFRDAMPGVEIDALCDDKDPMHRLELLKLRDAGELKEYSDDELLTVTLKAVWRRKF